MSLPPATRDISDHPAKTAVTDPANSAYIQKDAKRTVRLYDVIEALRVGKLPDNIQIDETLQYMATHSPVNINALSSEGSVLVQDIRDIIETIREIMKQKNADELFQNFVWHTRGLDFSPAKKDHREAAVTATDKAKADSLQAAHHLRTLLSLLVTNTEARKMFSDFSVIGRDLLARSAELIRPDEEALRRTDEPISSNEPAFVERDGSTGLPRAEEETIQKKIKNARQQVKKDLNTTKEDAKKMGKGEKTREGVDARLSELKERVPSKYRERVNAQFDRARHFFSDEYFPRERRDRFIFRAKKVVVECQNDKSYQESIKWFLDILPQYGREGVRVATKDKDSLKQGEFQGAMNELINILTRFANETSPQPAIDTFKRILQLAKEDDDMGKWVGHVQDWIRRVLLEPGYVLDLQSNRDGNTLREEGRKFYDGKYKAHFDDFFNAVSAWFTALTTDPLNTRFGEDWARLTRHLLFNADGKLTWKPELWADIRQVIIPQIIDKLGYIPIPRAEFSDENVDIVIENLALSGKNLFPNIVSIEAHNYAKFSPYTAIHDDSRHTFVITMGQIQADLRDVIFHFNQKRGIKIHDSGSADVLLGGSGITTTIRLQSAPHHSGSLFLVRSVHVKVDSLRFRIRNSQHDKLYKFLGPIATIIVKREIQRALTKSIKNMFETIDHLLVKVRDRMDEAKLTDGETRMSALKDFMTKQTQEMREKKARSEKPAHFKIPTKRGDRLLPDIGSQDAWFNKWQEDAQVISEGREWRSKVFTIVSTAAPARETFAGPSQTSGTVRR